MKKYNMISMKKDKSGENLALSALQMDIMLKGMDPNADPEQACAKWYIMFRSAQLFNTQFGRYPGVKSDGVSSMKEDAGKLYNIAVKLCSNLSLDECLVDEKHAVCMLTSAAAAVDFCCVACTLSRSKRCSKDSNTVT